MNVITFSSINQVENALKVELWDKCRVEKERDEFVIYGIDFFGCEHGPWYLDKYADYEDLKILADEINLKIAEAEAEAYDY